MLGLRRRITRCLDVIRRSPDERLPIPEIHRCSRGDCPSSPITTHELGACGVISCLANPDHPRTARLASLGLLPGVQIELVQKYPAFVLRIGHADIALDEELAGLVRILS
jgi:Fe2+ transport system protein FeoA